MLTSAPPGQARGHVYTARLCKTKLCAMSNITVPFQTNILFTLRVVRIPSMCRLGPHPSSSSPSLACLQHPGMPISGVPLWPELCRGGVGGRRNDCGALGLTIEIPPVPPAYALIRADVSLTDVVPLTPHIILGIPLSISSLSIGADSEACDTVGHTVLSDSEQRRFLSLSPRACFRCSPPPPQSICTLPTHSSVLFLDLANPFDPVPDSARRVCSAAVLSSSCQTPTSPLTTFRNTRKHKLPHLPFAGTKTTTYPPAHPPPP
ncbi:hypothetical protein B0T26DRAFT_197120 [Lasiosphaeria miniovina]|uniref:Uncharacterized protein n=1 Tax=Lasiosphaeria miniovina TaxID=1954250 RepID=A0AA40AU17_9PEZI|nr:uncharacterized protein B0T26DRAFT_197120 [Lasiosphaeria miniovina]KAK0721973.1 hypothetical protein B0T26DRAFT_197120 [Lasiosphaeria miniovina]